MAAELANLEELAQAVTELYDPVPATLADLIETHLSVGRLRVTEPLRERLRFDVDRGVVTVAREAREEGDDEIEDMFVEARCECPVPAVEITGVPPESVINLDGDLPWDQYLAAVVAFGRRVDASSITLADVERY